MTFMIIIFFFPTTPQTNIPNMNYTVVVLGGVLLLALAWYYFPVYGGVHWFTGPVPNVANADEGVEKASTNLSATDEKVDGVAVDGEDV